MVALKQSAYYAIGIVMMKGISLFMLPYITHTLSIAEYGSLEALILLADIGTILFSLGLLDAMYRYVGVAKGKERQNLISNCFTLSVITCVIGAAALLFCLPVILTVLPVKFETYQVVMLLIPTMLDGAISIPLTLMRMESLAKRFCQLTVLKAVLQGGLTIVLLEMGFGIDGVLFSAAISSVVLLIYLLPYQYQSMGGFGYIRYSEKLLRYSLPTLVGLASVYMLSGLDKWFMASLVGVEDLAIYAVAAKFALILGLAIQPYSLWWFPNRMTILKQVDGKSVCADRAILGVNIGVCIATVMILTIPGFISFALPQEYESAGVIAISLIVIHIIKNAGDMMNIGCYSGDSTHSQMWIQCCSAALAAVGYFVFGPIFGLWGIIFILGSAYSLRLILFFIVSQSHEKLPYRHTQWVLSVSIAVTAIIGHQYLLVLLPQFSAFMLGLVVSVVASLIFVKYSVIPIPPSVLSKFNLTWLTRSKHYP